MIFVHALGTAMIDAGDIRITPSSARRFAMLLYLSAESGRRVSRSTLHELICPEQSEKNARHTLRELLYQLRQVGVSLASDSHAVELPSEAVRSDYAAVLGQDRPDDAQIRAAEGGFLPSYSPDHSESFSEWYDAYKARSVFDLCKAFVRELARAKAAGEWRATERAARACLALDSLNEDATLALAETLAMGGAKAQAVALLDSYMRDVGSHSNNLRVPAALLRRRIGEDAPPAYRHKAGLPFLGRSNDLAFLSRKLQFAVAGESQFIVVRGEPGVGKSRLLGEFAASIRYANIAVEQIDVHSGDADRPLGGFVDLIPRLLQRPGALGCPPESMRALRTLTEVNEATEPALPDVAARLVRRAIIDVIDAIAAEQPLVLLVENIHWLDPISHRLLIGLTSPTEVPRRVMISATSRERTLASISLRQLPIVHEHILNRLDSESSAQLISAALRAAGLPVSENDVSWIRELSLGNPFFIETVVAEYGRTRDRASVPDTLTDILAARLVGLSDDATTVLGTAVLLGKLSSLARLSRALDVGGLRFLNALQELERANLLATTTGSVTPAHALVSEAFLRQTSRTWLAAAHRQVAEALTADASLSQSPSLLWECAEHWIEAGERNRAREFLVRCADHASAIGRPQAAAGILCRALRLEENRVERVQIARRLMITGADASDHALVLIGADALREMAIPPSHDELELVELAARFRFQFSNSDVEDQIVTCLTDTSASYEHRLKAATFALKYADAQGRVALAALVCSTFDPDSGVGQPHEKHEHEMFRALALCDFTTALEQCHRMLESLSGFDEWTQIRYQQNGCLALARCGREQEALDLISTALETSKRIGGDRLALRSSVFRSILLYDLCRDAEADAELEFAAKMDAELREFGVDVDFELNSIDIALFKGQVDRAASALERFVSSLVPGEFQSRWIAVVRARIRQLRDERIEEGLLATYQDSLAAGPITGLCDLEIATAIVELARTGRVETARRVIDDYSRRRPWRSRYSRCLQVALQETDVL